MSEQAPPRILIILGVITALVTIGIQVMSVGSLKGRIETVIEQHASLLKEHSEELREHNKLIERIHGRMGLSSSASFQRWKEAEPAQQQQ